MKKNKAPKKSSHPPIMGFVLGDLNKRFDQGIKTYGVPLKGFNGRDALLDAYEEAIDLTLYLRQAIYERDNKRRK